MSKEARPYIVWYKTSDDKQAAVHVTAYDVMDALFAANVKLAAERIMPTGFTNVEPDQAALEWQRQQRAEEITIDVAAALRNIVRPPGKKE